MTARRSFFTVTLLAALGISSANAVVLCAKKSGKVLVRDDACRARETAVLPGAVDVVGPAGPEGAAGVAGPTGLLAAEMVDATGKQFGTLIRRLGFEVVTTRVSGVDVPLQFVIADGQFFNESLQASVFYEAAGCTGAPFILDAGGLVPVAHVLGTRAYFSRTVPTLRNVVSVESEPSTPGDCGSASDTGRQTCCRNQTLMTNASPAEVFDVSLLGVTPPFSVVPR